MTTGNPAPLSDAVRAARAVLLRDAWDAALAREDWDEAERLEDELAALEDEG